MRHALGVQTVESIVFELGAVLGSPTLLYIVQVAGFLVGYKIGVLIGLQGSNTARITYGES